MAVANKTRKNENNDITIAVKKKVYHREHQHFFTKKSYN